MSLIANRIEKKKVNQMNGLVKRSMLVFSRATIGTIYLSAIKPGDFRLPERFSGRQSSLQDWWQLVSSQDDRVVHKSSLRLTLSAMGAKGRPAGANQRGRWIKDKARQAFSITAFLTTLAETPL